MEIRCATPVKIGQRIVDGCDREWTSRRATRDAVEHSSIRVSTRVLDGLGLCAIQGSGIAA